MAEVDTQIHKVLDPGDNSNPGAGPAPLQRWLIAPGLV
jgi:hypothetical protein